jgi:outer membrane lipoprotein-sorting protein
VRIEIASKYQRLGLSALILLSALGFFSSCAKQNPTTVEPVLTTIIPPFTTKEPARYRAVRTITSNDAGVESRPSRTVITRDGRMRREEYESAQGQPIVLLQIPAGTFILVPAAKLLANLDEVAAAEFQDRLEQTPELDLSTERLLNETAVEMRYQKLGAETQNGRGTIKYRVISSSTSGTEGQTETFVWIDDALAMPVRWETSVTVGENRKKTIMELSEISLEPDMRAFALPDDYRKVDIAVLNGWVAARSQKE